jgi:hypothetical protein
MRREGRTIITALRDEWAITFFVGDEKLTLTSCLISKGETLPKNFLFVISPQLA